MYESRFCYCKFVGQDWKRSSILSFAIIWSMYIPSFKPKVVIFSPVLVSSLVIPLGCFASNEIISTYGCGFLNNDEKAVAKI